MNICRIERLDHIKKITFDLQEKELVDFFDKIKRVAAKRKLIEVRCGNVLFTENEWQHYLDTKEVRK